MNDRRRFAASCVSGICAYAMPSVFAQSTSVAYPVRQITIVVPFAAGGPVDTVARTIAEPMQRLLRQPIVVENVAGAGGATGAVKVAKATADGYTLILGHAGTHAFNAALNPSLPYRPIDDFKPIALLATMPSVLSVRAASQFRTMDDLVTYARANPGKLNFGTAGAGSVSHLAALTLVDAAKIKVTYVSYRGSSPAFTDLIAGNIDALFDSSVQAVPQATSGRVRALAVTAGRRLEQLPKVPTLTESQCCGGLTLDIWFGLLAPRGIPNVAMNTLEAAALASLADAKFRSVMLNSSASMPDIARANREEFANLMRRDVERFASLAQRTGAKAEL